MMAAMRWFLAVILLLQTQVIEAFVFQTAAVVRRATTSLQMKWDPTRPPMTNMKRLEQRMDATWGRGKFRTEVWEGNVNPMNFWWEAYYFSDEEREALLAGYDMSDPAEWFRKQGLDPEECMERGKKYEAEQFELYLEEKRKNYKKPTRDEFKKKYAELKKLQQEVFEMAFRLQDDELQAKKGQPSLEDEDTGVQWKNDVPGESA